MSPALRFLFSESWRRISSGVATGQVTLMASSRAYMSGVLAMSAIFAFILPTIVRGVPAGAQIAYQLGT